MSDVEKSGIKRSTFERLVIATNYIKLLKEEIEVLKALLIQEKEEREAESKSFIEVRDQLLKLSPAEKRQIAREVEILEWKKRAKILRESIERYEAENRQLKLRNDHLIQKIASR